MTLLPDETVIIEQAIWSEETKQLSYLSVEPKGANNGLVLPAKTIIVPWMPHDTIDFVEELIDLTDSFGCVKSRLPDLVLPFASDADLSVRTAAGQVHRLIQAGFYREATYVCRWVRRTMCCESSPAPLPLWPLVLAEGAALYGLSDHESVVALICSAFGWRAAEERVAPSAASVIAALSGLRTGRVEWSHQLAQRAVKEMVQLNEWSVAVGACDRLVRLAMWIGDNALASHYMHLLESPAAREAVRAGNVPVSRWQRELSGRSCCPDSSCGNARQSQSTRY